MDLLPSVATGFLRVLNIAAGDIEVVFDAENPAETLRAIAMLKDMAKRGFLIAVRLEDGTFARAVDIDATRARYIVVVPDDIGLPADAVPVVEKRPAKRGRKVSVPIETSRAYGVARSAGG